MSVPVLDYFRRKAEFLPPDVQLSGIYVRPGELSVHANAVEWELVGRTFHPNQLQADDVERQGYCSRELRAGLDASRWNGNKFT